MTREPLKSPNPWNRNRTSVRKSKFLSVSSINTMLAARRDIILEGGLYYRFPWRHLPLATKNFFYRYGGHIELIGFKTYYGMPRGHEHDPIYSHQYVRLLSNFSLSFPRKRLLLKKKKIVEPSLDVIMIAFFPRIYIEVLFFARKARVNRRFWATHVNRNWGLLPYYMPWR